MEIKSESVFGKIVIVLMCVSALSLIIFVFSFLPVFNLFGSVFPRGPYWAFLWVSIGCFASVLNIYMFSAATDRSK